MEHAKPVENSFALLQCLIERKVSQYVIFTLNYLKLFLTYACRVLYNFYFKLIILSQNHGFNYVHGEMHFHMVIAVMSLGSYFWKKSISHMIFRIQCLVNHLYTFLIPIYVIERELDLCGNMMGESYLHRNFYLILFMQIIYLCINKISNRLADCCIFLDLITFTYVSFCQNCWLKIWMLLA